MVDSSDARDESLHWVAEADRYDGQLAPFAGLVLERASVARDETVLDVGCGCGAMTIDSAGQCAAAVGVDVSAGVLAVARRRAVDARVANVEFVEADAQRHRFERGGFDAVISRFGLMFFDDPTVAFGSLRLSLREGGRLVFVCWQGLEANEWLLVPGLAAAAHVALPTGVGARGPGMFSLADRDTLAQLLTVAGFGEIEIDPVAPSITLGGGGDLEETVEFLLGTGIARALFEGATPDSRLAATGDRRGDGCAPRVLRTGSRGRARHGRLARQCDFRALTVEGGPGLVAADQVGGPGEPEVLECGGGEAGTEPSLQTITIRRSWLVTSGRWCSHSGSSRHSSTFRATTHDRPG